MSRPLPLRAHLEWVRKLSKERLAEFRTTNPKAQFSDALLDVAREFGFSSWRQLKAHVEQLREQLDAIVPAEIRHLAAAETIAPDDPGLATFLQAIVDGESQSVTDMLTSRPALVVAKGADGQTALHLAAQYNDPELATILIAYGAEFDTKFGRSGHSALSWAVTCNAIECAQTLLKLGADTDLFCAAGIGALDHVQACFDGTELVAGASKTGSSRYSPDGTLLPCPPETAREQISDALYIACRNRQSGVVQFLMGKNPDLSFRAYMGGTPLHWAYFGGSHDIVELLLKCGADSGARDSALGCTPRAFGICTPANWGFAFLVRARLVDDPTLVNIMDGRTSPLHEAARNNRIDIARLLLEKGADAQLTDGDGRSPIDVARERGHAALVELLTSV